MVRAIRNVTEEPHKPNDDLTFDEDPTPQQSVQVPPHGGPSHPSRVSQFVKFAERYVEEGAASRRSLLGLRIELEKLVHKFLADLSRLDVPRLAPPFDVVHMGCVVGCRFANRISIFVTKAFIQPDQIGKSGSSAK
jgi:hypothetical protein